MTFAVIEKMHYSDFNSGNDDFKPTDILDEDDLNASDDEILKKFKNESMSEKNTELNDKSIANTESKQTIEVQDTQKD